MDRFLRGKVKGNKRCERGVASSGVLGGAGGNFNQGIPRPGPEGARKRRQVLQRPRKLAQTKGGTRDTNPRRKMGGKNREPIGHKFWPGERRRGAGGKSFFLLGLPKKTRVVGWGDGANLALMEKKFFGCSRPEFYKGPFWAVTR